MSIILINIHKLPKNWVSDECYQYPNDEIYSKIDAIWITFTIFVIPTKVKIGLSNKLDHPKEGEILYKIVFVQFYNSS